MPGPLWIDSFDLGTIGAINARYQGPTGSQGALSSILAGGRTGQAVQLGDGAVKNITPSGNQVFVGIAMFCSSGGWITKTFLSVQDSSGTEQLTVHGNADSTLSVVRGRFGAGGTVLATSNPLTQVVIDGFWTYVELRAVIDNTNGAFELRVNEQTWLSGSGVDTQNAASNNIGKIAFGGRTDGNGSGNSSWADDLYINDTHFWGNTKVIANFPNGVGSKSEWARGGADSGANYGQVDETAHNSDTDYVYHSTQGVKDRYAQAGLPGAASGKPVKAVQITNVAKKDDVLDRQIQIILYAGGRDYYSDGKILTTSYAHYYHITEIDPSTGTYWTYDGLKSSAFQFGTHLYV